MNLPLTAELCARAVVASGRALQMDPVQAFDPWPRRVRRPLAPAAAAVAQATGLTELAVARVFGIGPTTISKARRFGTDTFVFALTRALLELSSTPANAPIAKAAGVAPFKGDQPQPSAPERGNPTPGSALVRSPQPRLGRRPARAAFDPCASRATSPSDQALIDAAMASGRVTVCDPKVAAGVEVRGLQLKAEPVVPSSAFSWRKQRDDKLAAKRKGAL